MLRGFTAEGEAISFCSVGAELIDGQYSITTIGIDQGKFYASIGEGLSFDEAWGVAG